MSLWDNLKSFDWDLLLPGAALGKQPDYSNMPYLDMYPNKRDTYERFWPHKMAPDLPPDPVKNPFTGEYYLDDMAPIVKALAYLYNSQVIKDDPGFSAGGAEAGRVVRTGSPDMASRPSPSAQESMTGEPTLDRVIDALTSVQSEPNDQPQKEGVAREGSGEPASEKGSGIATLAQVIDQFAPNDLSSVIAAAGGDMASAPIDDTRVAIPDILKGGSGGGSEGADMAKSKADKSKSNAGSLKALSDVLGNIDVSNLGSMMAQVIARSEGGESQALPTQQTQGAPSGRNEAISQRMRQDVAGVQAPNQSMSQRMRQDVAGLPESEEGGGLPTWAKALIAIGGVGALAAVLKNGKFVQPGGQPLNWGQGLASGLGAFGDVIAAREAQKMEGERRADERKWQEQQTAEERQWKEEQSQQDFMRKILAQRLKEQTEDDPNKYLSDVPQGLRVRLLNAADETGRVPAPGSGEFSRIANEYMDEEKVSEAERLAIRKFTALDDVVFMLKMFPELANDPAVQQMIKAGFGQQLLGGMGVPQSGSVSERYESKGALFGD